MADLRGRREVLGSSAEAALSGVRCVAELRDRGVRVRVQSRLRDTGDLDGGVSAGLDWQTRAGFNAGIGANVLLKSSDSPFETAGLLPFLRLGWLF